MRMRRKSASVIAMFAMLMAVMIPQAGAFAGDDGETEDDENTEADEADPDAGEDEAGSDDAEGSDDTEGSGDDKADDGADEDPIEGSEDEALEDEGAFQTQTLDSGPIEIQDAGGNSPCPSSDGWVKKDGHTSADVLADPDAALSWGRSVFFFIATGWAEYDLPDGATLDLCIKGGRDAFASSDADAGTTPSNSRRTLTGLSGKDRVVLRTGKDISHVAWRYTPAPRCTSYTTAELREAIKASSVSGGMATLQGIPADACDDIRLSFTSYALPSGKIQPFSEQVLYDHVSKVVTAADNGSKLHVELPECGWQTDLYIVDRSVNPSHWTDDHAYHPLKDSEGHPGSILIKWDKNESAGPCFEVEVTAECVYQVGEHAIVALSNPTGFDIDILDSQGLLDAPSSLDAGQTVLVRAEIGKHGWVEFVGGKTAFDTKDLALCGANVTPVKLWADQGDHGDAGVTVRYRGDSAGVGESVFVPYGDRYRVTEDAQVDFENVDGLGRFRLQADDTSLEALIEVPTHEHVVTNRMKPEADIRIRALCEFDETLFRSVTVYEVANNGDAKVTIHLGDDSLKLKSGETHLFTSGSESETVTWGGEGTRYQAGSATADASSERCGEFVTPEKVWSDGGDHGDADVKVSYRGSNAKTGEQVFVPYGGWYFVSEALPVSFTNDSGLGFSRLSSKGLDLADIVDGERVHTHTVVNTPKPEIELVLDALCVYLPGDEDGFGIVTVTNPGDSKVLFSFTEGGPAGNDGPYLLLAGQTRTFQVDSDADVAIAWGGLFSRFAPGSTDADLGDALCGAEVTPVKEWDADEDVDLDVDLTLTSGGQVAGIGESVFVPFGGGFSVTEASGPWAALSGLGDFVLTLDDLGIDADDLAGIAADDLLHEHLVVNEQLFPSIALDKSADETAFVVLEEDGDTSYQVTYTYVVTNDGDLDLDGLTLIDDIVTLDEQVDLTEDLTAALMAAFGSTVLEVGDSVEVQWTTSYDVNEDPAQIDNIATVSGTDPFGTVVTDTDDESISSTFVGSVTEEKPEEKPEEQPEVAPEVLPQVESVSVVRKVEPKTEVLGVTLPRTGASVLALLISGLLALVAGGSALRRRRSEG